MTTAPVADASADPGQLLVAALSGAIRRLAAGEPAVAPVVDLPFDRERLSTLAAMLAFDDPEILDQLTDGAPGMLAFVARIEAALAPNRYLCDFLREACARYDDGRWVPVHDPSTDPAAATELVQVVHYAWFVDRLTRTMATDPTGAWFERLDRALVARFADSNWEQYANTFQRMKVRSLRTLGAWARTKRGERTPDWEVRWRLILNVLEAMGDDRRRGFHDNAAAGLPLVESPPSLPLDPALQNAWTSVDALGRQVQVPPRPELWNDLYTTWNLSFVSDYPAAPYFFAKLVCPVVADHRGAPGLYLYHRAVSLVLHIWFVAARRLDTAMWEKQIDWRDPELTRIWGEVNLRSAEDYRSRVDSPRFVGFRRRVRALWAVIRWFVRPGPRHSPAIRPR